MKKIIVVLLLAPLLLAAKGNPGGGCDKQLPTVTQIEYHLPDAIRYCKYAPKSPGPSATRRQTAIYITKLYDAWEECHGDLKEANRLYSKWKAQVAKFNGKKKKG